MSRDRNQPPAVSSDGQVMQHAGKYAKNAVLTAFEMIGGTQRMAQWADENPTDFYTKLFPKIMDREPPESGAESVEDMLDKLDRNMIDVTPDRDDNPDFSDITAADVAGEDAPPHQGDDDPWPDADEAELVEADDDQ